MESALLMWWERSDRRPNSVNPYLGVGYVIPERWTATEQGSLGGIQLLPAMTPSVYPAILLLRVFPDMQNSSPQYAIDDYVRHRKASSQQFTELSRAFAIHPSGFLYASVDYLIESNAFGRQESHHIIAYDIDGRASITASSACSFWHSFTSIRDSFIASLTVQRPELAISDHFRNNA